MKQTDQQATNPYLLSVIIPCFNEEGNVSTLTDRLLAVFLKLGINAEMVFVNDGSTDGTADILCKEANKHKQIIQICSHQTNLGLEAGWRTGSRAARGELVCIIDADLQYMPEDVERLFVSKGNSCADIIQGARLPIDEIKNHRYVFSKVFNYILNRTFDMSLKDNKSGFLLMKREIFQELLKHRFRYKYYQTLICVAAAYKGYTIESIDVKFNKRLSEKSFMSNIPVRVILGCLHDVIKGYFEFVLPKTFAKNEPVK